MDGAGVGVKVILQGVVGSRAYNLATADSDEDRLGVYVEPATAFHGLHLPIDRAASKVTTNPDIALHEARKFAQLCLKCNPTVMELLWLPADLYEERTYAGRHLISLRGSFLSARRVRDAYFGYASDQLRRLCVTGTFASKMRQRTEKHARHMLRLLDQGYRLYADGTLDVRLKDPERFLLFGEQVGQDNSVALAALRQYEEMFDAATSPLPDVPDIPVVESWLRDLRKAYPEEE
jgi:predicted nucleotidyltransferase